MVVYFTFKITQKDACKKIDHGASAGQVETSLGVIGIAFVSSLFDSFGQLPDSEVVVVVQLVTTDLLVTKNNN